MMERGSPVDWDTEGSKYHPLFEHLLFSGRERLSMGFSEIEAILGARLAPSARKRQEWWSNSPNGHSQARAWMRASYRTSAVDLANEAVTFAREVWPEQGVRAGNSAVESERMAGFSESAASSYSVAAMAGDGIAASDEHPLFGIWCGKATLLPEYDYTLPAFEADRST